MGNILRKVGKGVKLTAELLEKEAPLADRKLAETMGIGRDLGGVPGHNVPKWSEALEGSPKMSHGEPLESEIGRPRTQSELDLADEFGKAPDAVLPDQTSMDLEGGKMNAPKADQAEFNFKPDEPSAQMDLLKDVEHQGIGPDSIKSASVPQQIEIAGVMHGPAEELSQSTVKELMKTATDEQKLKFGAEWAKANKGKITAAMVAAAGLGAVVAGSPENKVPSAGATKTLASTPADESKLTGVDAEIAKQERVIKQKENAKIREAKAAELVNVSNRETYYEQMLNKRKEDLAFDLKLQNEGGELQQGRIYERRGAIKSDIEHYQKTLGFIKEQKAKVQKDIDATAETSYGDDFDDVRGGHAVRDVIAGKEPNKIKAAVQESTTPASGTELKTSGSTSKHAASITPISKDVKPAGQQGVSFDSQGYATLDTPEALAKVQAERNDMQDRAETGKLLSNFSAGLSSMHHKFEVKPEGQEYFDDLSKKGDRQVKDFEERVAKEKSDPKSAYSTGVRDLLFKTTGRKLPDSMSGEQVAKFAPSIVSLYETDEKLKEKNIEAQMRHEDTRFKYAELKAGKAEAEKIKDSKDAMKLYTKIAHDSNPGTASSRNTMGRMSMIMQKSKAIQALIDQVTTQKNWSDPRQVYEIAKSVDAMLSGSLGTVTGTHELIPETLRGKLASYQEYITNKPAGLDNKAFIKRIEETVKREASTAKAGLADEIQQAAAPLELYDREHGTDYYQQLLKKRNIGQEAPPASSGSDTVNIREKSTGRVKAVRAEQASHLLNDSRYERVK